MKRNRKSLDAKALLAKNPKAARIFENNQKKLAGRKTRPQREYGLGLPYARPALVAAATDANDELVP